MLFKAIVLRDQHRLEDLLENNHSRLHSASLCSGVLAHSFEVLLLEGEEDVHSQ
jgi:hypothetical protein